MKLRDVMVVLDNSTRNEAILEVATGIAMQHDAHLTGFCPTELVVPKDVNVALGAFPPLLALQEATEMTVMHTAAIVDGLGLSFSDVLRRNGLRGEWQASDGPAPKEVSERARTADLLVLGQPDPNHPVAGLAWSVVEDALLHAGRPLLLVPFAGRFGRIGSRVVIAWNGTREAARAAHDAMWLMDAGATVTVLTVEQARDEKSASVLGATMADHLARHGYAVTATSTVSDGTISDADALLSFVGDSGADLLVAGAYSHSRTLEAILGGVSRSLLHQMTLPVLMSH